MINAVRYRMVGVLVAAALLFTYSSSTALVQENEAAKGVERLHQQADDLKAVVKSKVGKSFLNSTKWLPTIEDREILVHRTESRRALSATEAKQLDDQQLEQFAPRKLDEHFYYFTRYGSPLAFVRPLEIAATSGLDKLQGKRIVDFGFGSIGHLRLLASQGADVTGIEVDLWLKGLYCQPLDTGEIKSGENVNVNSRTTNGRLELLFGSFPSEIADHLRGNVDWFISKNTLKRGYIHPEKPVDPRKLIQLGVTDQQFLRSVHQKLKTGGHFLIYNLHPAQAAEGKPYIPWADGRSPFSREALEQAGFEIVAFDVNDTIEIHRIAKALKWDQQMDLENDLFATYTLARKK